MFYAQKTEELKMYASENVKMVLVNAVVISVSWLGLIWRKHVCAIVIAIVLALSEVTFLLHFCSYPTCGRQADDAIQKSRKHAT